MKHTGLSLKEAKFRLKEHGYNELKEKRKLANLKILSRQLANFLVWVLLAAAFISFLIGEVINFWAISFILVFIIILGFIQEYKAEKAMEALKKIVQPTTKVIRNGRLVKILSREVVPGDLLALETGDKIPADAKVLETISLKIDEANLTGESSPVEKHRDNLIFAGTSIVRGKCKAVVVATGMGTKLGKIAELIQEDEGKTPLQTKINRLAKNLAFIALISCVAIFALAVFRTPTGEEIPLGKILIVALALAVASVPEGLPFTLTLTLTLGMRRMAKQNAIVRKMFAVETLGGTTIICSDKTGTITKNEMTVEKIFANDKIIRVTGVGYKPKGDFLLSGKKIDPKKDRTLNLLLKSSALCNNAVLEEKKGKWEIIGDPTEGALVVAAAKAEQWKDSLEKRYPRIEEILFTSKRKLMSTIHKSGQEKITFVKGAPEIVLGKCKWINKNGKEKILTEEELRNILKINKEFAGGALRVLSVAYKKVSGPLTPEKVEKNLVFLGLVAMMDPPREEVNNAIKMCRTAGIKIVMITGDNPETAKAISKEIGLFRTRKIFDGLKDEKLKKILEDGVVTGSELDELNEKEFGSIVEDIVIYARVSPEHKLRIVKALKQKGHTIAMTGDGVNDAPALKKADIGVAMGIKGTDVAKEASDMILQDDDFATIVAAVKEGRTIYENIRKFTYYLISTNFDEVILIMLGIILFGFNFLPLLALQILFINIMTEELASIALGMDPARKGIMRRPPRKGEILTKKGSLLVFTLAPFMALTAFMIFVFYNPSINILQARTMVFATLVCTTILNPFNFRSLDKSIFKTDILASKWLILAAAVATFMSLAVMYTPFLQVVFGLTTLSLSDWILPLAAGFSIIVFMEFVKIITRKIS